MHDVVNLVVALWTNDIQVLSHPETVTLLYIVLVSILILENGFLPTTFLPGDSLLFLTGTLAANDLINVHFTVALLTVGAAVGSEIGYLQGKLLGKTKTVQGWINHVPPKYRDKTKVMLHKHGIFALLIARFTAFVRTLMPLIIGLTGVEHRRFHVVNWVSAFLWVGVLIYISYTLGKTAVFQNNMDQILQILTLIPAVLIAFGIVTTLYVVWKRKNSEAQKKALSV